MSRPETTKPYSPPPACKTCGGDIENGVCVNWRSHDKPDTTPEAKLDCRFGPERLAAEGSQEFVGNALDVWLKELARVYPPSRKMIDGDLYA